MLKRKYLINKHQFDLIYKKGKSKNANYLYIKYLPNRKEYSQFGIVVSKKNVKLAVNRNRLKRIIKSEIFNHIDDIKKGYFFVIILKNNSSEDILNSEDILKKELINTIKNIN